MSFLEPKKAVEQFGIKPGMIAVDFGSGPGYFSLELAKLVGKDGKVYAVDVQKPVLEVLRSRAKTKHLSNIETIWADLEIPRASKLKDNLVDFVLLANILFQVENKKQLGGEAWRILKPKGLLGVIEWQDKFPKKEAEKLFLDAGFSLEKEISNTGDNHYGLVFTKL